MFQKAIEPEYRGKGTFRYTGEFETRSEILEGLLLPACYLLLPACYLLDFSRSVTGAHRYTMRKRPCILPPESAVSTFRKAGAFVFGVFVFDAEIVTSSSGTLNRCLSHGCCSCLLISPASFPSPLISPPSFPFILAPSPCPSSTLP